MKSTHNSRIPNSGFAPNPVSLPGSNGIATNGVAAGFEPIPSKEDLPAPILIVDDEPFVADLINHWVRDVWDYPSIIAYSGEDAIVAMREHHPRLVLLDLNLPDIHGIDVLRAIKSADEHLPVVMVSAQESVSTAVE